MIATLPPDEEQACSFFVEWRTEVRAEEKAQLDHSLIYHSRRLRAPHLKEASSEPLFPSWLSCAYHLSSNISASTAHERID